MHRWIHLLGAIALVLFVWTSTTARAEGYMPIPVAAESAGHFAGDKDEAPSDQHDNVPHHHFTCGEHAAAARTVSPTLEMAEPLGTPALARALPSLDGREPDLQIRPPIA